MDKRRLHFTYSPLVFSWLIDFVTKKWVVANSLVKHQIGPLHIAYYENHGIIMGSFYELPLMIRTVFLCTIGVSIVASYPLLVDLIHLRTRRMMIGLSLLFGGILGNVADRISHGFVVDLFYFKTTAFTTPVFKSRTWFSGALIF